MNKSSESFDKLRLDFISTVSHELRTPLTSIRGFAETLIASRDKLSDEQQLKFLSIIRDQSNRLINLVENMLSASSQAEAEEIYVLKPVSVKSALDKVLIILKQKYPRKDVRLNLGENIPEILVDTEKFEQILLNIVENACKYSFENSDIVISSSNYEEKMLSINVENEGFTIADSDKLKIFEKFTRLDNPMTSKTQGSGMGLYLALKIAKKMNGCIDVESKDERTVFKICFPVATHENVARSKIVGYKEFNDD